MIIIHKIKTKASMDVKKKKQFCQKIIVDD